MRIRARGETQGNNLKQRGDIKNDARLVMKIHFIHSVTMITIVLHCVEGEDGRDSIMRLSAVKPPIPGYCLRPSPVNKITRAGSRGPVCGGGPLSPSLGRLLSPVA